MKVVIAGSSGFLGTALRHVLADDGHEVVRLVRRPARAADESQWDPYAGTLDQAVVESADVVVNLAGSSLLGNPHSARFRRTLHDSRVVTTRLLAEAIARSDRVPAFLAQNGSGWYGDHGDELLTEDAESHGEAFMTRVCRDWEAATEPAREAGSRVCVLRTAPVIDRDSLVTRVQLPLFRLGLGARLSDGRQWFPVVSRRDWVAAAAFLLEHPTAAGPFNMASPVPPTNAEFTDALADSVHRRAFLVAPAPVLRLGAGALAPDLLGSYRLVPAALEAAGHHFFDQDVRDVVAAGLAHP